MARPEPAGARAPDEPDLPYARHSVDEDDVRAVAEVLRSDRLTQGPVVPRFEQELARVVGAPHAVAVSSGTAALHLALAALGVGPGDEVIVPPLTFAATVNAVLFCGARPVFADVEPDSLNLDPASVAARVGAATRGAIPVHLAGHPADMERLASAVGRGRFLLEDACHALGASVGERAAGTLGDAACFSFHPAKLVTTGEGGAVTTASEPLAERVRLLREHGIERRAQRFEGLGLPCELREEERGAWVYEQQALGPNYRLSDVAAALGRSQLAKQERFLARRRALVDRYRKALSGEPLVECPVERPGVRSAWHLFAVRLHVEALRGGRAAVFAALRARGIGVQVHYVPVHLQPFHRRTLGTRFGDLPVAEDAYLRLVSLPLFPQMADEDVARVVDTLRGELRRLRR
ncbi:MAG TPA: UDP-4-amino-4,6-dideoxy-N-acetyl-beta-L-altrosamine transaminase [Myxococcota bacterium]|nr:UDP-4-amino-4,6-dideoxy-N-acetyl-beta-L-altrosamine transaminase [Myxococcota bacterium]